MQGPGFLEAARRVEGGVGDWSPWGGAVSPDARSNVQRVAETLFEYIDVGGRGHINAELMAAAAEVLRPELFDSRLGAGSAPALAEILIPPDLGAKEISCRAFITHLRHTIATQPESGRVLQCACDIVLAQNGRMQRNWCLFFGSLPLLFGTFLTMVDSMWKGRFMAAMIIVHHANGVYCPRAHSIYANWGCRGIVADQPQICDVGVNRGTPLDPFGFYRIFGCGFGEDKFTNATTQRGWVDGVLIEPELRNCSHPDARRLRYVEDQVTLSELASDPLSSGCETQVAYDEAEQWCQPIPDNVVRTSDEYADALLEAVTPSGWEVVWIVFVLLALPACYYWSAAGRRWIMNTFPKESFEGVAGLTEGAGSGSGSRGGCYCRGCCGKDGSTERQYSREEVRKTGSTFAKLLLVGYVASCAGFVLSQFPIAPSPPSPQTKLDGTAVQHTQAACLFDWTQYPRDNLVGCTALESYYSAGIKRDAETLNLVMFLNIGTALFYSLWKGGQFSPTLSLEVHHVSRQLGRIRVTTMSAHKHSVISVNEVLEKMDGIVRFERRKRTARSAFHLFKSLITWLIPTVMMGTAIRWSDRLLADGIAYREGSVVGMLIVLCNLVGSFAIFYSMSHVFFSVAQHYEDMLERMRCLSKMLSPGPASGKGLPCIRVANLQNLHGWMRMRRFIIRWSGRKHLENSQFAMGLLVPVSLALGIASWFIVVGKPVTAYSCYVISWIIFFSLVLVSCGDSVLRAAIAINEEAARQAGLVRRAVLESQLDELGYERSWVVRSSSQDDGNSPDRERGLDFYSGSPPPSSRSPSPTASPRAEDIAEPPSGFHTPSKLKPGNVLLDPGPQSEPELEADDVTLLTPPVAMRAAGESPASAASPSAQRGSRLARPHPERAADAQHDALRSAMLGHMIDELMDDNLCSVRLSFFGEPQRACRRPRLARSPPQASRRAGVPLNRNLRSVFLGAFGAAVALVVNAARKSFPVPTGGAFIDAAR